MYINRPHRIIDRGCKSELLRGSSTKRRRIMLHTSHLNFPPCPSLRSTPTSRPLFETMALRPQNQPSTDPTVHRNLIPSLSRAQGTDCQGRQIRSLDRYPSVYHPFVLGCCARTRIQRYDYPQRISQTVGQTSLHSASFPTSFAKGHSTRLASCELDYRTSIELLTSC